MTTLKFYGKKSCITCQKAKAFLESEGVPFEEIPIETQPPGRDILERLIEANGIKASLNSRSSIYKQKNLGKNLPGKDAVIQLMLEDPNLIKRPVIINAQGKLYQGFDAETLQDFLK
jgi:arsenate reductase